MSIPPLAQRIPHWPALDTVFLITRILTTQEPRVLIMFQPSHNSLHMIWLLLFFIHEFFNQWSTPFLIFFLFTLWLKKQTKTIKEINQTKIRFHSFFKMHNFGLFSLVSYHLCSTWMTNQWKSYILHQGHDYEGLWQGKGNKEGWRLLEFATLTSGNFRKIAHHLNPCNSGKNATQVRMQDN